MANPMQADLTLLDLPLKRSGAIIASALGEFTAPSRQELVLLRPGGILELYRIEKHVVESNDNEEDDEEEEEVTKLKLIHRTETSSVLRSLAALRRTGMDRDHLAVGADGEVVAVHPRPAEGGETAEYRGGFGAMDQFELGHLLLFLVILLIIVGLNHVLLDAVQLEDAAGPEEDQFLTGRGGELPEGAGDYCAGSLQGQVQKG